jgi:hypothetical protein
MSNVKSQTLPNEYLMPIQKERRGYAKHFQEVYMPLLEGWFSKYKVHFDVKIDKKNPLWMCMVQAQPWMLNALPSAVLAKHADEIEAMIRLHAVAAPSLVDEEYWKAVEKRRIADHGKAFAIGMWMYRAGYNKVTFDFRGGGDEGWVENPTIHGRDEISLEDDDVFECMGVSMSSSEHIKNWCYEIMPQGFGDGDPYYEDGKGIITLRDMRFNLECLVEVRRSERCEEKGSIVSGINMPYPQD